MGLLDDSSAGKDCEAVFDIAVGVAALWNNFGGEKHGFKIKIGDAEVKECCRLGNEILTLSKKFPIPPSPFKRVAALVVLSKLYPFFELDPPQEVQIQDQIWLSRLSTLLIPGALALLEVNVSEDALAPKWALNRWNGFASPHYKIEFLKFIQWLDNFDWLMIGGEQDKWIQTKRERLARMIMSVSLIIEANYYLGEAGAPQREHLRGKCKLCLKSADLTGLTYDVEIYDNAIKVGYLK